MNKNKFTKQLREVANVIEPLTHDIYKGASVWNGVEYAKSEVDEKPHPYALMWWSKLMTLADFIDAQDSPLSRDQMNYLQHCLFGGIGSLNDLCFSTQAVGEVAHFVNKNLDKKREELYNDFKD